MRLRTKDEIKDYLTGKEIKMVSIEKTGSELKGRYEEIVLTFTDESLLYIQSKDSEDYSSELEYYSNTPL